MQIFTSKQVKEIDLRTIEKEAISSIDLMERAARKFTDWFTSNFDSSNRIVVFAGAGNNGGDALAISRLLIERNYEVHVYLIKNTNLLSESCETNYKRLRNYHSAEIIDSADSGKLPRLSKKDIVIDGIIGSGLNRPVDGIAAQVIRHINQNSGEVVSIDIPSGLFGEDNSINNFDSIVHASYTVSFEFPFLSFFMKENEKFTGKWEVISIGLDKETISSLESQYSTIEADSIRNLLIPRKKYSHKGTFGHALIIAGRHGMMGAAVLSVKACIRGGAGLTTACIPGYGYNILQTSIPEALIESANSNEFFNGFPDLNPYQAIACGPAIGRSDGTAEALRKLILAAKVPVVLDADALNILSEHQELLEQLPSGSVITPHPKEFDRLAGKSSDMFSRHLKQLEFSRRYNLLVILKGAHTIISDPSGMSYINTTGNPGMSTGGTGDVLTGLIVSLMVQGYSSLHASILAVFIHGLAGDIALDSSSEEALIASDIIEHFGRAFRIVKEDRY